MYQPRALGNWEYFLSCAIIPAIGAARLNNLEPTSSVDYGYNFYHSLNAWNSLL
jgi:hypothetical protein